MYRIFNTTFNNAAGEISNPDKVKIAQDAGTTGSRRNNYIFLDTAESIQLGLDLFERTTAFGSRFLGGVEGFPLYVSTTYTDPQTVYFGEDTLEFAQYIADVYGLTNEVPGLTNRIIGKLAFYFVSSTNFNVFPSITRYIRLTSNSSTYNYVGFKNLASSISNSLDLADPTGAFEAEIRVVANFSSSGDLQSIYFQNDSL